jgi:DNA mismatch endonuclease (patch repair protein)
MKPRSQETISYTMSRIRGKNTGIELTLRKELHARGIHYRCNSSFIYGHPDISMKGYKIVVFCDSEFWHGYHFEEAKAKIHSHLDYWISKIERNMARDKEVNEELSKEGYSILRFWGQEILKDPKGCADKVEALYKEKAKAIEEQDKKKRSR